MAERVQLQKQCSENQEQFAKILGQIIQVTSQKNSKDTELTSIKQKYSLLKNDGAQKIIETAGPRLWVYREQIKNKDEQFLLTNTFEKDIMDKKADELPDEDKIDYLKRIIMTIKNTWRTLNPTEKNMMWQYLQQLLGFYAGYIQAKRRVDELKSAAAAAK